MKRRLAVLAGLIFSLFLSLSHVAHAGGAVVISVQDGDWNTLSTWDIRIPAISSGDQVEVEHTVGVTLSGAEANVLGIIGGTLNAASKLKCNTELFRHWD